MGLTLKNHPLYQEEIAYILATKGLERLRGKTILITGSTGLIGTQMVDALMTYSLKGADVKVVAVARSLEKAKERFGEYFDSPFFEFLQQDVAEPFSPSIHADFIVPLASFTHPLAYSQAPIATMTTNIYGAINALRLAEREKATLVYPSTVEVYGNMKGDTPFCEDMTGELDLSTSRSCYTEAKRTCEALCQSFLSEKGVDVKVARLCRVFGPTLLPDDSKASSQFIHKAVAGKDIILKSEGKQLFSYIYTADAVSALLYIMLNGEKGVAYNVANEGCNVHIKDFAEICAKQVGQTVVYEIPDQVEKKGYSIATKAVLNGARLTALGWTPRYNIDNAISHTITILRDK